MPRAEYVNGASRERKLETALRDWRVPAPCYLSARIFAVVATRTILTDSHTPIWKNDASVTLGDLKIGDRIVVVGSPDSQGQINARVVRVLDPNVTPKYMRPFFQKSKWIRRV